MAQFQKEIAPSWQQRWQHFLPEYVTLRGGKEIDTEAAGDSVNTAALKRRSNVSVSLSIGKPVEDDSILLVYASSAPCGRAAPT